MENMDLPPEKIMADTYEAFSELSKTLGEESIYKEIMLEELFKIILRIK
jgi:hypothetical protein